MNTEEPLFQFELLEVLNNIDNKDYLIFRVAMMALTVLIMVFGCGLLGCIWHFERFGGDPQKRTILNQLIGMLAFDSMVVLMETLLALLYRLCFGRISHTMTLFTFIVPTVSISILVLLILNEIILLRWISVFLWKQLPPINDFFAMFFNCLNIGITAMFVSFGLLGGHRYSNLSFLMSGTYFLREPKLSIGNFFGATVLTTIIIHGVCGIPLLYKKKLLNKIKVDKPINGQGPARYNTRTNVDLANGLVNVATIACFTTFLAFNDWKEDIVVASLLTFLVPLSVVNVIVPLKLVLSKPDIRNHLKATFNLFSGILLNP